MEEQTALSLCKGHLGAGGASTMPQGLFTIGVVAGITLESSVMDEITPG